MRLQASVDQSGTADKTITLCWQEDFRNRRWQIALLHRRKASTTLLNVRRGLQMKAVYLR
jgi:hypothetical protein